MNRSRPSPLLIALLIGVVFGAVYYWTASQSFTYDSITMAMAIEGNFLNNVLGAAHLLWGAVAWVVYRLITAAGQAYRALLVLQRINCVIAGLDLGIIFWLIQRDFGWKRGLLSAAFLGVSFTMWFESADPGAYPWAVLAVSILLYLLVTPMNLSGFWIGVIHAAAALTHQMLIFAAPAFLLRLRREQRLSYLIGLCSVVAAVYAAVVLIFHQGSLREGLLWAFGPAGWPVGRRLEVFHWWNIDIPTNILKSLSAIGHSAVAYTKGSGADRIESFIRPAVAVILIAGGWWAHRRRMSSNRLFVVLMIWIALLELVFLIYSPGTARFQLICVPVVIYAFWLTEAGNLRNWGLGGLLLVTLVLGIYNFKIWVRPNMRPENNASLIRILAIDRIAHPGDYYLFGATGNSIINIYLPYFAGDLKGRSLGGYYFEQPQGDLSELRAVIDQVRKEGGHLYVEGQLFDRAFVRRFESEHQLPPGRVERWIQSLGSRRREYKIGPDYSIYLVI